MIFIIRTKKTQTKTKNSRKCYALLLTLVLLEKMSAILENVHPFLAAPVRNWWTTVEDNFHSFYWLTMNFNCLFCFPPSSFFHYFCWNRKEDKRSVDMAPWGLLTAGGEVGWEVNITQSSSTHVSLTLLVLASISKRYKGWKSEGKPMGNLKFTTSYIKVC